MKVAGWAGVLLLTFAAGTMGQQEKTGPIELKIVKYRGLAQAVEMNRGKVVVVDFWGVL